MFFIDIMLFPSFIFQRTSYIGTGALIMKLKNIFFYCVAKTFYLKWSTLLKNINRHLTINCIFLNDCKATIQLRYVKNMFPSQLKFVQYIMKKLRYRKHFISKIIATFLECYKIRICKTRFRCYSSIWYVFYFIQALSLSKFCLTFFLPLLRKGIHVNRILWDK